MNPLKLHIELGVYLSEKRVHSFHHLLKEVHDLKEVKSDLQTSNISVTWEPDRNSISWSQL